MVLYCKKEHTAECTHINRMCLSIDYRIFCNDRSNGKYPSIMNEALISLYL
jgi:hypothetical protein